MKTRALLTAALLAVPAIATAQAPRYTPQFLGTAQPGRMNESAQVIGRATIAGNTRAVVMQAGHPDRILPLPAGMLSSTAYDINDPGVVVGQVGPYYSPEFVGRAAAWYPDGHGGYSVVVFGVLPGHVISSAAAVNNLGDIVGYSGDGTFRRPVYFRAPGDLVDLHPTGIFDPVDINEQRVLVDQSSSVQRLDLDTMIAEDLGIPAPPGGSRYTATRSSAINESGQVAGCAILATGTDCDRQVARYTDGVGWEIFSSCGRYNGASDINDRGDMVMLIIIAPYVRFEGGGTYALESLIVNDIGHWYAVTTSAGWINNNRQIVMYGTNPTTGQTGALLLTPEAEPMTGVPATGGDATVRLAMSAEPNPFRDATSIGFDLPEPGPVSLQIFDVAGRRVRTLIDETRLSGHHEVGWDGRDGHGAVVSGGVYFYRLIVEGSSIARRMVVLH